MVKIKLKQFIQKLFSITNLVLWPQSLKSTKQPKDTKQLFELSGICISVEMSLQEVLANSSGTNDKLMM